jgi:hypothetical protein
LTVTVYVSQITMDMSHLTATVYVSQMTIDMSRLS